MKTEFNIYEVDKYDNRWFVCRHSTIESAKYWLETVAPTADQDASFKIFDKDGGEID